MVRAALERVEARNASLNAFVTLTAEPAQEQARAAEAQLAAGTAPDSPLFGLPYSVKDLTLTAGVRTTMGSPLFADQVPKEDAVPVARLKQAGAILIGKTTTPEFGHKALTDSPLFGRTLNPWDPQVTCGGSSGGAAVAAVTGMGAFALGTDGGGSVRIPSACCGIVGLKATLGAIPHLHVPDLFGANSYIGPMARRVADVRLVWRAIAGPSPRDPYGQTPPPRGRHLADGLEGLRIGVMAKVGDHDVHPEVAASFEAVTRRLAALGATLEEVAFDFVALEEAFLVILQSALAARLAEPAAGRPEAVSPSLAKTIELGKDWSAIDLQKAGAARSDAFGAVQIAFETHDLLVSPTLTAPPLPADQDPHALVSIAGGPGHRIRAAWYPYTYPFNLTGHPALSLPCGTTEASLPLGFQIVGPWHGEELILDVAEALEAELPTIGRPPT